MVKVDNSILEAALVGYKAKHAEICLRIAEVQMALLEDGRKLRPQGAADPESGLFAVPRKKLSDETRLARIAKRAAKRAATA